MQQPAAAPSWHQSVLDQFQRVCAHCHVSHEVVGASQTLLSIKLGGRLEESTHALRTQDLLAQLLEVAPSHFGIDVYCIVHEDEEDVYGLLRDWSHKRWASMPHTYDELLKKCNSFRVERCDFNADGTMYCGRHCLSRAEWPPRWVAGVYQVDLHAPTPGLHGPAGNLPAGPGYC